MKHFYTFLLFLCTFSSYAQMGIGTSTPHPGAALDITSDGKALLIPRVTQANRPGEPGKAAATPGMIVYQTDGTPGFYLYNWDGWVKMMTPMDVKPQGFAYLRGYFYPNSGYVLNVEPVFPLWIPFQVPISNGDVYSEAPNTVTLAKSGIYSIEYDITPLSVTGNQYQVMLFITENTGNSNGVVPGSVITSTVGNPKIHGHVMLSATRQAKLSLLLLPYPNNSTSVLTFGSSENEHKISVKVVRQLRWD